MKSSLSGGLMFLKIPVLWCSRVFILKNKIIPVWGLIFLKTHVWWFLSFLLKKLKGVDEFLSCWMVLYHFRLFPFSKVTNITAAVFPRGPKRGNPKMTVSTIMARRNGYPQHYGEGIQNIYAQNGSGHWIKKACPRNSSDYQTLWLLWGMGMWTYRLAAPQSWK